MDKIRKLNTGINDLDKMLGGLVNGEIVCIAGRRAMGKTGLALSIVKRACIKEGKTCLYFALAEDKAHIIKRLPDAGEAPLYINDRAFSVKKIKKACKKLGKKNKIDLIVIDYLQLIWSKRGYLTLVSNKLRKLARKLDCPIIVLCQLDYRIGSREDNRPVLSDLVHTGAMNDYADKVLFLHRDDYYNIDSDKKGILEVFVAKNVYGRNIGSVELAYKSH